MPFSLLFEELVALQRFVPIHSVESLAVFVVVREFVVV